MKLSDYKNENLWLMQGDCLERMKEIPGGSVDAIICDPPYETTACKWDSIIPLDSMWEQLNRIVKPSGAIVLFASQPFSSVMIVSNLKNFAHQWVWNKRFAANFVQAKRQPLKDHEDVIVFSTNGKQPAYYPQMVKRDVPIKKGKNKDESGAIPLVANSSYDKKVYDEKYPTSCESMKFNVRDDRGLHPTQKPVALMEYIIKTYTNGGETVLDFTMGSGSTGVGCMNTGRKFIGIEKDEDYFEVACNRIKGEQQ